MEKDDDVGPRAGRGILICTYSLLTLPETRMMHVLRYMLKDLIHSSMLHASIVRYYMFTIPCDQKTRPILRRRYPMVIPERFCVWILPMSCAIVC